MTNVIYVVGYDAQALVVLTKIEIVQHADGGSSPSLAWSRLVEDDDAASSDVGSRGSKTRILLRRRGSVDVAASEILIVAPHFYARVDAETGATNFLSRASSFLPEAEVPNVAHDPIADTLYSAGGANGVTLVVYEHDVQTGDALAGVDLSADLAAAKAHTTSYVFDIYVNVDLATSKTSILRVLGAFVNSDTVGSYTGWRSPTQRPGLPRRRRRRRPGPRRARVDARRDLCRLTDVGQDRVSLQGLRLGRRLPASAVHRQERRQGLRL